MIDETKAPRLLPLTLALSVLLWFFITTGGKQIFVNEVLGEAYDSQAEHFLRGDPGVDVEAIRHEAIIVDGKVRMYFGPFPAFLRIPLNFIYPGGRGNWSRVSGFCAAIISLFAFAGLIRECLRFSKLSPRARDWVGNASLAGFALGSPLLLLLGNLSIYDEATVWGLAWSVAAICFIYRSRNAEGRRVTLSLLGFSLCAVDALLSRVTFGAPFFLLAPVIAFYLPRGNRLQKLLALFVPLALGGGFYLFLSFAKFGTFIGLSFQHYINSLHRNFALEHGIFSLRRVPYAFADYFSLHFPAFQNQPPFLTGTRHPYEYSSIFCLPFSETYVSIIWSSAWLVFGAIIGVAYLFRSASSGLDRAAVVAFFAQFICILSFFALAQRYATDLYPFLIVCFLIFLRSDAVVSIRVRQALVVLVAVSALINSLTTISWLVDSDLNVPPKTRAAWSALLGRGLPEKEKLEQAD